ncbi:MAG: alcohol dehydrogenase catalytic domain-containing protein [Gammaproteobacteria bacterium]
MRAFLLEETAAMEPGKPPLAFVDLPEPEPGPGEIRIRVATCGVCHTELDEIESRTPPPRLPVVPGHQVVGLVDACGPGAAMHALGSRVGVGWIHHSSGTRDENLSPEFRATGRDEHGGYAEYMTVPQAYAYPIPAEFTDIEAAPLLCAGAVGYRSLRLAQMADDRALGLTGFGGSGHLVLQLAKHLYPNCRVHVFARDPQQREFARSLGADWSGATEEPSPEPLDAVIDTTPAWLPVLEALRNLRPGGRLVINAIRKEAADVDVMRTISYHDHLWYEKEIKSVANVSHFDIEEFLPLAAAVPLRPEVQVYPFEEANRALLDLRFGQIRGAKVLQMASG